MTTLAFLLTQVVNALSQSALLFFLGVGLTLIFGLMRIVNFAHGALYMLGAFVGYSLTKWSGNYWLALAVAPLVVGLFGAAFEFAILRRLWGDWPACKQQLPRGHARSLVDYLAQHPGDFKGAVQRLRPELRGLYLSAYQSHLWNHMLVDWLSERIVRDVSGAWLFAKKAAVRAFATAPSIAKTRVSVSGILLRTPCSMRTPRMRPPRSTIAITASSVLVAPAARASRFSTSSGSRCVRISRASG